MNSSTVKPARLSGLRGRGVLTFLYTACTDLCPLVTQTIRVVYGNTFRPEELAHDIETLLTR